MRKIEEKLGLLKDDMPQFDEKSGAAFRDYLVSRGVSVQRTTSSADDLGKTQKSLSGLKVQAMVRSHEAGEFPELTKDPIMVSNDNYVLDGHHRWAAIRKLGQNVPVWIINLPIGQLVQQANEWLMTRGADLIEAVLRGQSPKKTLDEATR